MAYHKSYLSLVAIVFLFGGCAQEPKLPSQSIVSKEEIKANVKIAGSQELSSMREEGVYSVGNDKVYVKTDGRSILSILDDIAFKKRFNYTILTQIPNTRIKLCNDDDFNKKWEDARGQIFSSQMELLTFLENFMNASCQDCGYKVSVANDGIVISKSSASDMNATYVNSYKKVFLFHSTVDETIKSIDSFFGVKEGDAKKYSLVPIKSQNALLIKADKDTLAQITEVITSIDSNFPQVMIESQVFEYDDSISRKIGTALDYGRKTNDYNYGVKTVFGEGITSLLPSFFNTLNDPAKKQTLLFNIAAQDRNGGVKIVAEPRVVLKPGNKGTIDLATSKYVIVTGVNTSDLRELKTGVTLEITPTILSEDTIELTIHLSQSEFIPTNETDIVQSVNKNTIDTSLVVHDGELVSIGGIYLQKDGGFNSGIPLLKDIPGLGFLFGSTSKENSRVMIEFMIKPTIKKLQKELSERTKTVMELQMQDVNGTKE